MEFKRFCGHDLHTYGMDYILDYGEALRKEDFEEGEHGVHVMKELINDPNFTSQVDIKAYFSFH